MIEGKLRQIVTWTHNIDFWSRPNGQCDIAKRLAIRDLDEISDFVPQSNDGLGARDKSAPSYGAFKTFGRTARLGVH